MLTGRGKENTSVTLMTRISDHLEKGIFIFCPIQAF